MGKVGREDACIQGCCVYKNRTKKLDVKISTDNEGRANCRAAMSMKKKKTVVSLATFVALQVWYGIPNERVPKFEGCESTFFGSQQ